MAPICPDPDTSEEVNIRDGSSSDAKILTCDGICAIPGHLFNRHTVGDTVDSSADDISKVDHQSQLVDHQMAFVMVHA